MATDNPTVKELDQLFSQSKTGRSWLEPIWILNLAYYSGWQWLAWNGRQLFQPTLRPNQITYVENRILGCVRTEIAKMTKQRPTFLVDPASADEEDVNAADLGERVMRYLWDHLNCLEVVTKALEWSRVTGAGFLKCTWDSTVGDSTEVLVSSVSGNVLTGPPGPNGEAGPPLRPGQMSPEFLGQLGIPQESIHVKRVARGEIKLEAKSPFQIFSDPIADSLDECEWIGEESIQSKEYVWRRYGVELQPDTPANPGLVEVKLGAFVPGASPYRGISIREYWSKPCKQYPNGTRIVYASKAKKILEQDDNPFDCLPYVMFSAIPVPGRFWPSSTVEQLRGTQTDLNKLLSQISENCNRLGNPTMLASKQAVQDPEKFADSIASPGGIYFFDDVGSPNAIPKYLEAPELPNYTLERLQHLIQAFEDISGQHEVTSAQVPPGVTAASAINLLQEADNTRLGPGIADFERQLSKLGQKMLALIGNYYTDQRLLRIAGDDGAADIQSFRGSDLKGNTNVRVQTGSAFPQSTAAKQAALTDLLRMMAQMGVPMDPKMLGQFLQDWEIGGADRLIEMFTRSDQQVNAENMKLAQGQALPLNSYDDDQVHIDGHEDYQRGSHYSTLPPQAKQIFELHVAAHRERLAQQQQAEMAMQAQMQQGQQPQQGVPPELQAQQAQEQHQQQLEQNTHQQSQQAGFDQAAQEQKQRQAEEEHRQRLQQQQQQHEARLQQQQESHRQQLQQGELKMQQMIQQAAQRRQQQQQRPQAPEKGSNGR